MRRWIFFGAAAVLGLWACSTLNSPFPGNEVMGAFAFNTLLPALPDGGLDASYAFTDCPFPEVLTGNFSFQGTFSRNKGTPEAWFSLGGVARQATFDGQVVTSTLSAPRQFAECDGGVTLVETLSVALLSRSQNDALGGCPPDALDGGLPFNPDAGILRPDTAPAGFDAVRACGVLVDQVAPSVECVGGFPNPNQFCSMRYPVAGDRR